MRVLYLTHHLPWPSYSGGRLREAELLRRMASGSFDIELVAVSKTVHEDLLFVSSASELGIDAHVFAAHPRWTPWNGPLVSRHDSAMARIYLSEVAQRNDVDVVHVEGHYLLSLLPAKLRQRAVLVEHNVESNLLAQQLRACKSPRRLIELRRSWALTRWDEIRAWRAANSIVTVTEADKTAIEARLPDASVCVVPNGYDHLDKSRQRRPQGALGFDRADLVMVGNYAYQPSEDAALRLLTSVFPLILRQRPATTLTLVGNQPSARMRDAAADPRVTITGRVTDVGEWLTAASVFVCPLRVGGGIKVKIVEALAHGRVVVTTPIGAQGLESANREALVVREDDAAIAAECVNLLQHPDQLRRRSAKARQSVASMSTWDDAADMLASRWLGSVPGRNWIETRVV